MTTEDKNEAMIAGMFNKQIMRGVLPLQTDIDRVNKNYTGEKKDLALKVLAQDKKLVNKSIDDFISYQRKNGTFSDSLNSIGKNVELIASSIKQRVAEPVYAGVEQKISEFTRIISQNEEKIKKDQETLPEIQRKKKENDDFFKKFVGEKKVWLDRLKEVKLQDDAYKKGFKYLYEAKTIKLLLEGIMLEKVQDEVEKELCERGQSFGWDVMDEHRLAEERKKEEFELNVSLLEKNEEEAARIEREKREEWDREDKKQAIEREKISELWKKIWSEIWLPGVPLTTDEDFKTKREFVKKVTMDVTFRIFAKKCFDVWKFKNIINSAEEYVILDKMRKYFPETNQNRPNRDEGILDILMDMIDNIKQEEEIIYCNLEPAKQKLKEYQSNSKTESSAIDRIRNLIQKIGNIQALLKSDSTALIRTDVEEVKQMIKAIPDDKEQKLFKDNLVNESRLYDRFLPLTNLLMVVSFISIGEKRNKGYEAKLEKLKEEISMMKMVNNELGGKKELLVEMRDKLKETEGKDLIVESQKDIDDEYNKNIKAVQDSKGILNKIIQIKNKIEKTKFGYYKKLKETVIKPKDI